MYYDSLTVFNDKERKIDIQTLPVMRVLMMII